MGRRKRLPPAAMPTLHLHILEGPTDHWKMQSITSKCRMMVVNCGARPPRSGGEENTLILK